MRRKGGHFLGTARSIVEDTRKESSEGERGTGIGLGLETSGQEEEEGGGRLSRDHGCWETFSPAAPFPNTQDPADKG